MDPLLRCLYTRGRIQSVKLTARDSDGYEVTYEACKSGWPPFTTDFAAETRVSKSLEKFVCFG